MRKHIGVSPKKYALLAGVGLDAAYQDIHQGNIESIRIGKRKIIIPVPAIERKFGLDPGDLDDKIDAMGG